MALSTGGRSHGTGRRWAWPGAGQLQTAAETADSQPGTVSFSWFNTKFSLHDHGHTEMEDGSGKEFLDVCGGIIHYHAASSDRVGSMQEERSTRFRPRSILSLRQRLAVAQYIRSVSILIAIDVSTAAHPSRGRGRCEDSARTGEGLLTGLRKLDRTRASRNMSGATKTRRKIASHVATFRYTAAQLRGVQRATALVLVDGRAGEFNMRCGMRSNLLKRVSRRRTTIDVRYGAINESSHSKTPVARQKVVAIACHKA